jgi:quercetin 2,3-dioxygenase
MSTQREVSLTSISHINASPHRGFETVTYMLKGSFQHEDFSGHKGTINPGDLQWMTAGKGIVHVTNV